MIPFVVLANIFFTLYIDSAMNPHPIPQNVTSFQFRLVGDMTLKQFLYLAAGSSIAYGIFVFFAAKYPFLTWPLIVISALLGVAFAFLPISSRPLDHWVAAFFKAIYSPTRRAWKKNDKSFKEDSLFNSRLVLYLSGLNPHQAPAENKPPPATPPPQPLPVAPFPTADELAKTVDLARQAQNLQFRIVQTERALNQIKTEATQPTPIPVDYSQQINQVMSNLQTLVNQASAVREQMEQVTEPQKPQAKEPEKEKIKVVIPVKVKQTQVALTTFPNVINGIVKAKSGSYLEGVIAVIHDKEGLPVRALKTNKLGQFTGSTPLPNGTYTLELEKENFTFDVLQIELSGEVLPPLLITAK
ncbi:MAG: Uncharacterized protein G01um10147_345 [Microgenomates group bacterium Gr01-1014_7]|nr:MAG: Uncharacterized protein G01um10147_345 [Microgenomates group bacterium Gr01-1014_7]